MAIVNVYTHTQDCERVIAHGALMCYSDLNYEERVEKLMNEDPNKWVNMIMDLGHYSVLEHASITFSIDGISRAATHQLVRHRIASPSQRSQRYVFEGDFEFYTPKEIECDKELDEVYFNTMSTITGAYQYLMNNVVCATCKDGKADESGFCEINSCPHGKKKRAQELARYVLPNACESSILETFNFSSLINLFSQRMCMRADDEIRDIAHDMYKLAVEICPTVFSKVGPKCKNLLYCPENKMQHPKCKGKIKTKNEVREILKTLNIKL